MKPYFYIFNSKREKPTTKHATLEKAKAEAERLARKHPGESFEILLAIGVSRCPESLTFWYDNITKSGKPLS